MFRLLQIAIIGGADGPTSIYVADSSPWIAILLIIAGVAFTGFVIYRFIHNAKRHNKVKAIICGVVLAVILFICSFSIFQFVSCLKYSKIIETYSTPEMNEDL